MKKTGLPLQYSFWKRPLILAMKSATHSENNRGASIPSLFSVLISEYLSLGSSTSPTWDRTRFQQTRGGGTSGKRTLKSQVCHSRISLSLTFHSIQQGHIIRLNGLSSWMSGS